MKIQGAKKAIEQNMIGFKSITAAKNWQDIFHILDKIPKYLIKCAKQTPSKIVNLKIFITSS